MCCISKGNPVGGGAASECTPAGLDSTNPAAALPRCGAALLRGALAPGPLGEALEAFLRLPPEEARRLRHGAVRERREQTHLPFSPPFDRLDLLGEREQLRPALAAALGEGFVLDLATIVAVPEGAAAQSAHRDTPLAGSVAAHIPLHPLGEEAAPLSLCVGTHTMPSDEAKQLMKEALLWRPKGEDAEDAKRRLYCGGRQPTEALRFEVATGPQAAVRLRDSRLGARVMGFETLEAEALPWRPGDEISHVGGRRLSMREDFSELLEGAAGPVEVRVERPAGELPTVPPRLTVGAPLAVGDVLLYDSRTFHWGMANAANKTRYVLYVNFKSSDQHDGVHPEAAGTQELREARAAFQRKLLQLRDKESGPAEL